MFGLILKKELKAFFTSKGNLVFMIALPVLLISIFSFALGSYIQGDYGTFADGKVLYYSGSTSEEQQKQFSVIAEQITLSTGVVFEQTDNIEQAKALVESSQAYGVISISDAGFEYYRSPFNEPEGGKVVRSLFVQLAQNQGQDAEAAEVQKVILDASRPDAKSYYTFAALAFSLLFMGLLIAHSVHDEKALDTIVRIKLSKSGVGRMMLSKVLTGILCGCGQIAVAFLYSSVLLGVDWGNRLPWMLFILILLALYSAVFGAVVGMLSKNKSMCQSTVLMVSMLCGYLGGSITPLYLLENMPVLNLLVRVSPLYWTNRAMISLSNGFLNEQTLYSVLVLAGLSCFLFAFYMIWGNRADQKEKRQQRKEVPAA